MTKPTKWLCAQRRFRSSLCAEWVAKDPSFLHADNEDSDQSGLMPRLIWVFAGRTLTLLVLSFRGSIINHGTPDIIAVMFGNRASNYLDGEGMVNSVETDQTALIGAVWSRSALFAHAYQSQNLGFFMVIGYKLVCFHSGQIYAVGGHNGNKHLSSGEVFDPTSGKWRKIANMVTQKTGVWVFTCLPVLIHVVCHLIKISLT